LGMGVYGAGRLLQHLSSSSTRASSEAATKLPPQWRRPTFAVISFVQACCNLNSLKDGIVGGVWCGWIVGCVFGMIRAWCSSTFYLVMDTRRRRQEEYIFQVNNICWCWSNLVQLLELGQNCPSFKLGWFCLSFFVPYDFNKFHHGRCPSSELR
jgi:hypothetical protein